MKKKNLVLIAAFAVFQGVLAIPSDKALTMDEIGQFVLGPDDPKIEHVVIYDDSGLQILVIDYDKIEETIGQNTIYEKGVMYYFKIRDEQGEIKDGKYLKE